MNQLLNYAIPLAVVLVGLYLLKRELDVAAAQADAHANAKPAPVAAPEPEVPLAVIAAAVAAVVAEPHHVIQVKPTREVSWSLEGRRQLLLSHQIRK